MQISEPAGNRMSSAFGKWLKNISAASFVGKDKVVTRDFSTLKLWDCRYPSKPVYSAPVTDYLERNLG